MNDKLEQRKLLKALRQQLSEDNRTLQSEAIAASIFAHTAWIQANTIHCYVSFGTEVSTERIIARAWEEEKDVIVPVVEHATKEHLTDLMHVRITPETRFVSDSFGIPTPQYLPQHLVNPSEILTSTDCILVPLLGFDDHNYRIGYGKGHYDRFLARLPNVPAFGLAFACQRVERVVTEPHDVPLRGIFTVE